VILNRNPNCNAAREVTEDCDVVITKSGSAVFGDASAIQRAGTLKEAFSMECGGTGVFDHDAALDGEAIAQGKAVSPLLRRSATALHKTRDQNS
jgi:hypothetical protein